MRSKDGTEYRFGFVDDVNRNNHGEQLVTNMYYSDWECHDPINPSRPDCWFGGRPPQNATYAGERPGKVAYRWRLDQVRDTSDNRIVYRYEEARDRVRDAASYLAEVYYTLGGQRGARRPADQHEPERFSSSAVQAGVSIPCSHQEGTRSRAEWVISGHKPKRGRVDALCRPISRNGTSWKGA